MSYSKKLDMRIMYGVLCAILITFFYPCNVKAQEIVTDNNSNTFLEQFYSGDKSVYVTNDDGDNVTESFIEKTSEMYYEGNFSAIQEIIAEEEVVLHIIKEESDLQTWAYERYKTVQSEMFYFVLADEYDNTKLGVESELSGGIWYDEATSEVKRVTNCTYTILAYDTDAPLSITASDFSTGSNVVNGKGYFWGQCSFVGTGQQMSDQGHIYNAHCDYGTKRVSFYAVP